LLLIFISMARSMSIKTILSRAALAAALTVAFAAGSTPALAQYQYRIAIAGIRPAASAAPILANDALLAPATGVIATSRNGAWSAPTPYPYVWNTANSSSGAAAGSVNFETLLTNNTGAAEAFYAHISVDDQVTGFKISGVAQAISCSGFTTVCVAGPYTLPPGTSRINIQGTNQGGPAGLSMWFTSGSAAGPVIGSTSSDFYSTTASF
jgi:hypothetical protein